MTNDKDPSRVPYNTGKVKIGSRYEPPRRYTMSRDAEIIQRLFLGHKKPKWYRYNTLGLTLIILIILLIAGATL